MHVAASFWRRAALAGKEGGQLDIPAPVTIYVAYVARRGSQPWPRPLLPPLPYVRRGVCSDTLCLSHANVIHKAFGGDLVIFGPSVILA